MRRTSLMKALEKAYRKPVEAILRDAREKHESVEAAAVSLGLNSDTFRAWEKAVASENGATQ